ncbi:GntR family transcriptional regulator [Microbaculum marinum]|uniref:GntR family transcriptional regulator n=1 Tax=Microbaculum marinum TaxID=1764581 RepID=A0AAW9RCL5_9HYPH
MSTLDTKSEGALRPKGTLATSTFATLRHEIIAGEIAPGARLKIRSLCDRLNVGISPVREALNRLTAEGLVKQWDQHGFTVAPLTEEDLVDVTTTRCWLNEIGLRKSIANGDAEWEEDVLLACHRLTHLPRLVKDDAAYRTREWSAAHMAFHHALVRASGSSRLTKFCDDLFDVAERYRHVSRRHGRTRNAADEHKAIADAAISRDADLAVRLLTEHYWRTTELGREALRQMG